jgi:hypothetical protein
MKFRRTFNNNKHAFGPVFGGLLMVSICVLVTVPMAVYMGSEAEEMDSAIEKSALNDIYTTNDEAINKPPEIRAFTFNGPSEGEKDTLYEFTVCGEDPDGDDVYYKIDWGDGEVTDWLGPYSSGEEVQLTKSWSAEKVYEVIPKVKDHPHGEEISRVVNMEITSGEPAIPDGDGGKDDEEPVYL